MSEVLSQGEIDALLSALSSGELSADEIRKEESERKVRTYDFKRAMRFSKDQLRSLSRIHESFSRLLTTYFSAQFRTFVQVSVLTVDQLPYEEFIQSIPKMTILHVFSVSPLEGNFVMEVSPPIANAMLDRLLGGVGASADQIRPLTEIETALLTRIFERALVSYEEAWKGINEIHPMMELLEVNPQFLQMVSPNETVALVSLSTRIGESSGMINICMPHVVLEPVIPKLSAHYWMNLKKPKDHSEDTVILQNNLRRAHLPIRAELGNSQIAVQELLELAIGDVITLNQSVRDPLLIRVGEAVKFSGQPGLSRGRVAIQITEVLEEGVNLDE